MSRVAPIVTNFTAGELSPRLRGRVDYAKYPNGAGALQNWLIHAQGGLSKRPGSRFIAEQKNTGHGVRQIPFEFSTTQAYMLEFGQLYFRVYKDEGVVETSPGVPFEKATNFNYDEMRDVGYVQSADVLYLAHGDHRPQKVSRTSHTVWSLDDIDFVDGPYLNANTTATTFAPAATTGSGIDLTASVATFDGNRDIGRHVRIQHGSTWGWAKITAVTSTTVAVITIISDFGNTTAVTTWRLGAWYVGNYPRTVGFNASRLVWGNTALEPHKFWGSRSADFETHSPTETDGTVQDDNGISWPIVADTVCAILWFKSKGGTLIIGTTGGEFKARAGGSLNTPITPTNIDVVQMTDYGSSKVPICSAENSILYVEREGLRVREMRYDLNVDDFVSNDLTILSEHLFQVGPRTIVEAAFQKQPGGMYWAVLDDGSLLTMTYLPAQQVIAWGRQPIAGTLDDGPAFVESVCSIPFAGGNQVYISVKRTINGVTKWYTELIEEDFRAANANDKEFAFFLDSGLTLDNTKNAILTLGALTGTGVAVSTSSAIFVAGDVDRYIKFRYLDRTTNLYVTAKAQIVGYTDSQHVTVDIITDFPELTVAANEWRMSVTTITGLDHLEGEEVGVFGDGAVQINRTVVGGSITVTAACTVSVGLRNRSVLGLLPFEGGGQSGTSQGKPKRISAVTMRLLDTMGLKMGESEDTVEEVQFRDTEAPMDNSQPLYSGDYPMPVDSSYDPTKAYVIVSDDPTPVTILALMPEAVVYK